MLSNLISNIGVLWSSTLGLLPLVTQAGLAIGAAFLLVYVARRRAAFLLLGACALLYALAPMLAWMLRHGIA
jgi:hypothetical protein